MKIYVALSLCILHPGFLNNSKARTMDGPVRITHYPFTLPYLFPYLFVTARMSYWCAKDCSRMVCFPHSYPPAAHFILSVNYYFYKKARFAVDLPHSFTRLNVDPLRLVRSVNTSNLRVPSSLVASRPNTHSFNHHIFSFNLVPSLPGPPKRTVLKSPPEPSSSIERSLVVSLFSVSHPYLSIFLSWMNAAPAGCKQ